MSKGLEYYIPPEMRKQVQFLLGLNPVEAFKSAGDKFGKFIGSGGKDLRSGAEGVIDTLTLGAAPLARGIMTLKKPIEKVSTEGIEALGDLFSISTKKFDPTPTPYYRGELRGRSAEKFDPEGRGIYISKSSDHGASYTFGVDDKGRAIYSDGATVYKVRLNENARIFDYADPKNFKFIEEFYKKNKKKINQFRQNKEDDFFKKIKRGDFDVIENPFRDGTPAFEDFLKTKGFDGHTTGEPFTKSSGEKVIAGNVKVYNADDIVSAFDPLVQGKAQGGLATLDHEARNMFRKPRGIASLTV